MYCKKCGEEFDDNATVCPKCGASTNEVSSDPKYNQSKTGMGFVMGFFLGLIGLVIGMLSYPEGTVARKTFVKSWITTILVSWGIGLISVFILTLSSTGH